MALITWQGDDLTNPTYWNDADNWDTGTVPTTGDDVVLTGANDCFINVATAALNSFTMLGFTGHLTGTFNMTVTVASGTSAVVFDNGADASNTWSGTLLLNPAAGTTINLTAGGWTTWNGITIAGTTTGMVNLVDAVSLAATKVFTLTSGTLHTDGAADNSSLSHTVGTYTINGANTLTLYQGNSTITCLDGGGIQGWNTTTNMTLYAGTSTIVLSGTNAIFSDSGGPGTSKPPYAISFTGAGTAEYRGGGTVTNFSRIGTNTATCSLGAVGSHSMPAVTGTLTLTGFSPTTKLQVFSTTLGTQTSISCTGTIVADNVVFRDIAFTTGKNTDLSDGDTRLVGDCGGNTLAGGYTLTFTTSTTQTCTGSSANWSTATWTSRIPLPQDTVVISLTSGQTLTIDMLRLGKDISFGTATKIQLTTTAITSFGSINATGSGTWTGAITTWTIQNMNRTGNIYLTWAGKAGMGSGFQGYIVACPNTVVNLLDFMTCSSNNLSISSGTFTVNSGGGIGVGATLTTSSGAVLNLGDSTTSYCIALTNNGTINFETSTFTLVTGSSNRTYAFGNATVNNVVINTGTGIATITGNSSFKSLTINAPKTVKFNPGSVQTIGTFNAVGTLGNVITLQTGGAAATLTKSGGGTIQCNYLNITAVNVTPANTWYYGNQSTWNSGTGWGVLAPNFFQLF